MEKIGLEAVLLMSGFNAGVSQFLGGTKQMEGAAATLGQTLNTVGDKLLGTGAKMSAAITAPLAIVATKAIDTASDVAESMSKVSVVFGDSSEAIVNWSKDGAEALGQSQKQALDAAGTFGNLFTSMGMAGDQAAEMSMDIVELAADLASFNNIDTGTALEKLRSGLVGEAEPLRALGVNINEATVKAEALRLGLMRVGGELSTQGAIQARYSLIMQQTGNAQGDFARTSDGLANSQRILKAEMENAAAELGQALMPTMQKAVGAARDLLGWFTSLPEPIKSTGLALAAVTAVAGPLTTAIGAISKAFALLMAHPAIAAFVGLTVGIIAIIKWLKDTEAQTRRTAAAILDTADDYAEYRSEVDKAGVSTEMMSAELYNVYKNARKAGNEIEAIEFMKAADEMEELLSQFSVLEWPSMEQEYQDDAAALAVYNANIRGLMRESSNLALMLATDKAAVQQWGVELGKTDEEIEQWTSSILAAAEVETMWRNSQRTTAWAAIHLAGEVRGEAAAVDGLRGSTIVAKADLDKLKISHDDAAAAAGAQKSAIELLMGAMQSASTAISGSIAGLIQDWDALTAAERNAAEMAVAQELLAQAQAMLSSGEITAAQFAELWGAFKEEFGTLVDPAQATTDKITAMFGQWALDAGVSAGDLATALGNMGVTMDTAARDAQQAETAFITTFTAPKQPIKNLGSDLVTLGKRITEIPEPDPIAFDMPNYDETLKDIDEVTKAINAIPTDVTVNVHVNLTGDPNLVPQSPHTLLEYALINLAETARKVANLRVGIGLAADGFSRAMAAWSMPGFTASRTMLPALASGGEGGTSYGGDTINLYVGNRDAWADAQRWVESRRRDRLNAGM